MKVWTRPIGLVPARRALAGLEPGGESGRRAARFAARLAPAARWSSRRLGGRLRAERAQAMPAVLGVCLLVVAVAAILLAIGGAATAKGRLQRSADLAAISAARSMRDDFPRLFVPPRLANGLPNPAHLDKADYLDRAGAAAREAAERNGLAPRLVEVDFPDGESFAPLRVRVAASGEIELDGSGGGRRRDDRRHREGGGDAADRLAGRIGGPGDGNRRRLRRAPRLPAGEADAPRRGGGVRPDGRGRGGRRGHARGQLRVPLRRRAGRALRGQPRSAHGRPARNLAAPLRHRARPRATGGLRLAGEQRLAVRLRPALQLGGLALRLHRRPGALLGGGRERRGGGGRRRRQDGGLGGAAGLRPRSVPGHDPRRRRPLRRLGGAARRPAHGRVELQPATRARRPAPRASPSSCRRPPPPTASRTRSTRRRRSSPRRT